MAANEGGQRPWSYEAMVALKFIEFFQIAAEDGPCAFYLLPAHMAGLEAMPLQATLASHLGSTVAPPTFETFADDMQTAEPSEALESLVLAADGARCLFIFCHKNRPWKMAHCEEPHC